MHRLLFMLCGLGAVIIDQGTALHVRLLPQVVQSQAVAALQSRGVAADASSCDDAQFQTCLTYFSSQLGLPGIQNALEFSAFVDKMIATETGFVELCLDVRNLMYCLRATADSCFSTGHLQSVGVSANDAAVYHTMYGQLVYECGVGFRSTYVDSCGFTELNAALLQCESAYIATVQRNSTLLCQATQAYVDCDSDLLLGACGLSAGNAVCESLLAGLVSTLPQCALNCNDIAESTPANTHATKGPLTAPSGTSTSTAEPVQTSKLPTISAGTTNTGTTNQPHVITTTTPTHTTKTTPRAPPVSSGTSSTDACDDNFCNNGATCVPDPSNTTYGYDCHCTELYTGEFCDDQNCGTNVAIPDGSAKYGVLQSPNYPNNYPDDFDCKWNLILPQPTSQVWLAFEDLATEEDDDRITISYGSGSSAVSTQYSGFSPPNTILLVPGDNITVEFYSDGSNNYRGFKMAYHTASANCSEVSGELSEPDFKLYCKNGGTCLPAQALNATSCLCPPKFTGRDCGTEMNMCEYPHPCENNATCTPIGLEDYTCTCVSPFYGRNCSAAPQCSNKDSPVTLAVPDGPDAYGLLESPNYPNNYPDDYDCTWNLAGPSASSQVWLAFYDLNTEEDSDVVTISYTGNDDGTQFSGLDQPLPATILVPTQNVTIRFYSDGSDDYRGFVLAYHTATPTCVETVGALSGFRKTCQNGGSCVGLQGLTDVFCMCPPQWTGPDCSTPNSL